jgi:hypothetical protein
MNKLTTDDLQEIDNQENGSSPKYEVKLSPEDEAWYLFILLAQFDDWFKPEDICSNYPISPEDALKICCRFKYFFASHCINGTIWSFKRMIRFIEH